MHGDPRASPLLVEVSSFCRLGEYPVPAIGTTSHLNFFTPAQRAVTRAAHVLTFSLVRTI